MARKSLRVFSESESVQTSDANQNIIERIANLQKQINELRQILTLPPGPPRPPEPPGLTKSLVSQVVTASKVAVPNNDADTVVTASCPAGKTLIGGGFDFEQTTSIFLHSSGPGPGSSWTVKVLNADPPETEHFIKAFAICAGLE